MLLWFDQSLFENLTPTVRALSRFFQNVIRHARIGSCNAVDNVIEWESGHLPRCNARTTRSAAPLGGELRTRRARQPAVLVLGRRSRRTLESDFSILRSHAAATSRDATTQPLEAHDELNVISTWVCSCAFRGSPLQKKSPEHSVLGTTSLSSQV